MNKKFLLTLCILALCSCNNVNNSCITAIEDDFDQEVMTNITDTLAKSIEK